MICRRFSQDNKKVPEAASPGTCFSVRFMGLFTVHFDPYVYPYGDLQRFTVFSSKSPKPLKIKGFAYTHLQHFHIVSRCEVDKHLLTLNLDAVLYITPKGHELIAPAKNEEARKKILNVALGNIAPSVIQEVMRHTKFSTTQRYIHPDTKSAHDAVNTLNRGNS